ncbi:uncharacterized protein TNIN_41481 [Trichonephila inaurata madagascariensis]|uniref:Secreted protein n=1 Tax=Trichonephila inaurata madagascariensis TaxID=2747483 RepID=A0A8X6XDN2_9ARAC|nr:uncharacterized protein TNIN_41481 [Trichonephila inaurata madagascariensis]
MFLVVVAVSLLSGVFGQQTEGGVNVIFARPFRSNTSDVISGQSYPNAHLVFVTESNRGELRTADGVVQQGEAHTEMPRFECGTYNPCAWQPYKWEGDTLVAGEYHPSVCYCPLDKKCTYHRDNINLRMFVFLCYPLTPTTTTNSTGEV